jgi:hypothetical protein
MLHNLVEAVVIGHDPQRDRTILGVAGAMRGTPQSGEATITSSRAIDFGIEDSLRRGGLELIPRSRVKRRPSAG